MAARKCYAWFFFQNPQTLDLLIDRFQIIFRVAAAQEHPRELLRITAEQIRKIAHGIRQPGQRIFSVCHGRAQILDHRFRLSLDLALRLVHHRRGRAHRFLHDLIHIHVLHHRFLLLQN